MADAHEDEETVIEEEYKVQGDFFNWASPGFAKCWTVSN